MSKAKKCLKCSGKMEKGELWASVVWPRAKGKFQVTRQLTVYRCKTCGYIELYIEKIPEDEGYVHGD